MKLVFFAVSLCSASAFVSQSRTSFPLATSPSIVTKTTVATTGAISQALSSTALCFQSNRNNAAASNEKQAGEWDTDAVTKYVTALVVQFTLLWAVLTGLDVAQDAVRAGNPSIDSFFAADVALFYVTALKSRVLNPLANNRPNRKEIDNNNKSTKVPADTETTTIRPSWTPPGVVFPIVWLLVVGPLRAFASALVVETTHSYADPAILALMLHLCIGDVWNTINNVEQKRGLAVTGVACVWLSKANAAYQYYQVDETAGLALGATLIWLTIAGALVTRTWQLNPDPSTGELEPLYPATGKVETKFAWGSKTE